MDSLTPEKIPRSQQAIAVLWPSFITAIVASGVFFSAFNPRDLIRLTSISTSVRWRLYSIGFFLFWLLAFVSSFGTLYFTISNCRFLNKQDK